MSLRNGELWEWRITVESKDVGRRYHCEETSLRVYEYRIEPAEWEEIYGNEVTDWRVMLWEGCIIEEIKSLKYRLVVVRRQCSN